MVWIKRNLIFVITVAVGLLLTGYCGWILYSSLDANSGVSEDYKSTLANLQALQQKAPFPSKENIAAAKADQERVRMFLADFRKSFAPFPAPLVRDEKGFKTYLEDSLVRFRAEATNAGVQFPADYAFSFSGLMGKLTYPAGSIAGWMQQLEEIDTILNILYGAKINYLGPLQRVPITADESAADCLQATTVTNQWGVVTPYKITFRGFSTEIAAVMEGFARSSNCFIIKSIDVAPDKTVQPIVTQSLPQQPVAAYTPQFTSPEQNRFRGGPGMVPGLRPPAAPVARVAVAPTPTANAGPPVTILAENPLLVTISVDVVKLKASEH